MLATSASCECEGLLLVGVGVVVGTTVDGAAANVSVTLTYFVAFIVSGFFFFFSLSFSGSSFHHFFHNKLCSTRCVSAQQRWRGPGCVKRFDWVKQCQLMIAVN